MELSEEIQSILQKYKVQATPKTPPSKEADSAYSPDDLIDVDEIPMTDDQTWLTEPEVGRTVDDLDKWLYEDFRTPLDHLTVIRDKSKLASPKKHFDSRTFTRPKKRFNRPSIEKYNEEYFEIERKSFTALSDEIDSYVSSCKDDDAQIRFKEGPLHFDLSQPTSGNFFDRILSTAPELDSFQNMSPPSLVNSMCSSTFTNLMENSYIKNDPVLREIRDADYSQEIFQDAEPPLFQSITESCSSINSEVAENFVRRTLGTLNGTFNMTSSEESYKTPTETDPDTDTCADNHSGENYKTQHEIKSENSFNIKLNVPLNGTFRKSNNSKIDSTITIDDKLHSTFNKGRLLEDRGKIQENLNNTITKLSQKEREQLNNLERSRSGVTTNGYFADEKENVDVKWQLNTTFNKEQNNLNNTFKLTEHNNLNRGVPTPAIRNNLDATFDRKNTYSSDKTEKRLNNHLGSRRLSAEIDDYLSEKVNNALERERNNSMRLSADSSDSLDRMSSLSNSSRDSRHMLMAEVDAIVEQQERSLQVMSTPKPAKSLSKLFENTCLSPIPNLNTKEHLSDSEISSEEYMTVRTGVVSTRDRANLDRNVKSLSNLKQPIEQNKPRGINTNSNLRLIAPKLKSSYGNLRPTADRGSYTNLRSLGPNLKASYTSLKPYNSNLPNIPPKSLNETVIKSEANVVRSNDGPKSAEVFKVPQVPKEFNPASGNGAFAKQNKVSSLPRPISSATGIPRPMSKIPAPKSVRSASATGRTLTRPSSKINVNDGFY